ncbi:MAG: DUF6531 domain-containing protein [Candidatus Sericytochromatia bacterium]|nr:DUF6531 domain-containing protein [Candidatus Sericytochromatia bacterium]
MSSPHRAGFVALGLGREAAPLGPGLALLLATGLGLMTPAPARAAVSLQEGEFYLLAREPAVPAGSAFVPERLYRHGSTRAGLLGPGWGSTLETRLDLGPDGTVTLVAWGHLPRQAFTPLAGGAGAYRALARTHTHCPQPCEDRVPAVLTRTATGYDLVTGARLERFDARGRLVAVDLGRGAGWVVTHDRGGRPAAVRDRAGRTARFSYDSAGRATAITDATGRGVRYRYDGAGRLTAVEATGARRSRYTYVGATDSRLATAAGPGVAPLRVRYAGPAGRHLVAEVREAGAEQGASSYTFEGFNASPPPGTKPVRLAHTHITRGALKICAIDRFWLERDEAGRLWCVRSEATVDGQRVVDTMHDRTGAVLLRR